MDKNFSFSALLQMQAHGNKHKIKPTHLIHIEGGIKRRLESSVKNRQRTRLSAFDNFRNLPNCEPPAPVELNKVEQRKLQLQKWKEEKEKKKKEAMTQKKKPFVIGIAKTPLNYVPPPPPVVKPVPSTSGRVTRSQANKINKCVKNNANNSEQTRFTKSFAPKNAIFNPDLKELNKPSLNQITEEDIECKENDAPEQVRRNLRTRAKTHNIEIKKKMNPVRSERKKNEVREKYQAENSEKHQIVTTNYANSEYEKDTIINSTTVTSSSNVVADLKPKLTKRKNVKKANKLRKTPNSNKISSKIISIDDNSSPDIFLMEEDMNMKTPTRKSNKKSVDIKDINTTIEDFITFTPAKSVPKSESSSEERLRSPKVADLNLTPKQIEEEARKISPRVCISRGKDNARNEMKKRIDDGLLDDDVCDMTVEHFRRQLDSETKRMTQMCEEWSQISEQLTLPDTIQEALLAALGQARLLMSQKLQQFSSLLSRCERPEPGAALVTHGDLQGFWDMVFMQVVNIDLRFKKLEQCRDRGWVEEQPVSKARRAPKPAARPSGPKATSRLKDLIAAARKAKKAQPAVEQVETLPETETKTFEAGFFNIQSPVKAPNALTPGSAKPSLLKAVLSSEAKKASSRKSSFAMLRASSISKDIDKDDTSQYMDNMMPLTPVNLNVTPGRSILKANSTKKDPKLKPIKVLFYDTMTSSGTNDKDSIQSDISGVEIIRDSSILEAREERRQSRRGRRPVVRQEACDEDTMVMTRSRRKSMQTPVSEETRRSRSKNTLQEINMEGNEITPVRTSRRKNKLSENV